MLRPDVGICLGPSLRRGTIPRSPSSRSWYSDASLSNCSVRISPTMSGRLGGVWNIAAGAVSGLGSPIVISSVAKWYLEVARVGCTVRRANKKACRWCFSDGSSCSFSGIFGMWTFTVRALCSKVWDFPNSDPVTSRDSTLARAQASAVKLTSSSTFLVPPYLFDCAK
jgi:hypothetical protein